MRLRPIAIAALTVSLSAFAADPFVGTWRINVEKSKLRTPATGTGTTMTIEPSAEGQGTYRIAFGKEDDVQKRVDLRTYDGKERPSAMNPGQTEISEFPDARTRRTTFKKDGNLTSIVTSTLSLDGKTMTNVVKGLDDKGKSYEEVRVWDRK